MTFTGNLNKKCYDIYSTQTADFHNTSQSQWLMMIANDVACIWMPHYHEFALILYSFISLSLFSPPPSFTFSHCPTLISKTAHLACYRKWWEEMSCSTASSRPAHWNVKAVSGWRDVEMERWLFHCGFFFKEWCFFFLSFFWWLF